VETESIFKLETLLGVFAERMDALNKDKTGFDFINIGSLNLSELGKLNIRLLKLTLINLHIRD